MPATLETFASFPRHRQAVSSGALSALIQLQRQDLLTGLVDVMYGPAEQALLFFNVGAPFALFELREKRWRRVPPSQWSVSFARPDGEAAIVPLDGDALRLALLALETEPSQTETILLRPAGLKAHIGGLRPRDAASLLWVRHETLQAMIFVPGRGLSARDAVVFSPSGASSDEDAFSQLTGMSDQLIRISQIEYAGMPDFLNEYALRVAFLVLAESSLKRFEELAGDTLVESLGQEINRYAFHQGWKIQFFGGRVQHRQFFPSAPEAAAVYRGLFRSMREYAHRVVGGALAASMVREGLQSLPAAYREAFERQDFITV
ncbi:MAG: hypothetical protein HFACDABA_01304 [Anaerolineales bacterium]|nr:hypothetical protein [Anaerolineales bacterium]